MGAHIVLFSRDADADRAVLRDAFGLDSVDAGGGWLIFGLPPAEAAIHPAETPGAELYFMCPDLDVEIERLVAHGLECGPVERPRWGAVTKVRLPGGGEIGVYQPSHPTMIGPT